MQVQNSSSSFYQEIYCHNYHKENHYFKSYTRLVVSGAQKNANRWAIDELQRDSRQYHQGPGMILGLLLAQSALAVMASSEVESQKQGSQRINNIGMANNVILKLPKAKESRIMALTKFSKPNAL